MRKGHNGEKKGKKPGGKKEKETSDENNGHNVVCQQSTAQTTTECCTLVPIDSKLLLSCVTPSNSLAVDYTSTSYIPLCFFNFFQLRNKRFQMAGLSEVKVI